MNYIRAKFPNSIRSYVYRTEDSVKSGDTVVNADGAKLTVTDESVDMKWVETYGADKMAVVKKYEEPEKKKKSGVIQMKPTIDTMIYHTMLNIDQLLIIGVNNSDDNIKEVYGGEQGLLRLIQGYFELYKELKKCKESEE